MKIRIFADATLPIDLSRLVAGLASVVPYVAWSAGVSAFAVGENFISVPGTYDALSARFRKEVAGENRAFLFTEKPYDNNYFFESSDAKVIVVSLFGWEHLTNLPRANGVVYFIAALLVRHLKIGESHKNQNTGCINDFWYDKTGIDTGMRAAFLCAKCAGRKHAAKSAPVKQQIDALLDEISSASRGNVDILDYWLDSAAPGAESFNVFLCHNSNDKPAVRLLNRLLRARGLSTWLDEEQLPPGRPWQELLEAQIQSIGSVAVIVGASGLGPWQDVEMRAFISEFVRRRCPVIPVILSDCDSIPQLPLFMQQFTWVDFRKDEPSPIEMLIWGVTGKRPARSNAKKLVEPSVRKRKAA